MQNTSGSQPFLNGSTLLSYLIFCDTPIILFNNKKVFISNLSMISQFSSQNHAYFGLRSQKIKAKKSQKVKKNS